uniref:trihelix transcription factor ASIL2-like n=1 Tax=Erigeron canadensis TaxID=72917 RepID=UPI001CB8DA9C|nr:trihelix transcription factor ASIL2-like [Erigeron canadensis]
MSTTAGQKPTRKFPPPCWTRDEALSLIEAYRERWHALHRAFLRTTDWDAVAEKVNDAFPDVMPLKTSAQCRHKIEKLRQRHRAEQQRAAAFAGEKFFSNWFYFEAMEALDNGYVSEPGDQMVVNLKTRNNNGSNPGRGIRFKPSEAQKLAILPAKNNKKQNPNFISKVSNRINNGSLIKTPIQETPKIQNIRPRVTAKPGVQEPVSNEPGRPGLRPRKFSKVLCDDDDNEDVDDGEMWFKVPRRKNVARGEYRNEKYSVPNGKDVKKGKGKKKGGMSEVVASIRLLGDGFMKAEMMKIDMAREIEKMRMESEMKRSRLLLESQRQIVDAFVKGVVESRKLPAPLVDL